MEHALDKVPLGSLVRRMGVRWGGGGAGWRGHCAAAAAAAARLLLVVQMPPAVPRGRHAGGVQGGTASPVSHLRPRQRLFQIITAVFIGAGVVLSRAGNRTIAIPAPHDAHTTIP
jgi:hypothetical protein